ncbi:MAG: PorV/PorQ family protein [Gemmatimonadetes bacterium]|nr:PorV/PorQ family protein [Gemmatimonadota bacterium]
MRLQSSERLILAAALFLGGAHPLAGQGQALEPGGAAFLLVPVGARASGLGRAGVADGGSSESAFWNPAGLASLDTSEIAVHRATTFASDNTVLSGYVASRTLGTVGVAAYLVDYGSQEVVPGGGRTAAGSISPRNVELLASYATDLFGAFAVGLNYKLIQFRQDCSGDCTPFRTIVGTTHGIDLGVQYGFGESDALRIGIALLHAGFDLQVNNRSQADPLPTRLQLGAVYRVRLPTSPEAGAPLDARLLVDLQEPWGSYGNPDARVGIELAYGQLIKIRSGYAFLNAESAGPSLGVGLRFGRLALDFARVFFEESSLENPVYLTIRAIL